MILEQAFLLAHFVVVDETRFVIDRIEIQTFASAEFVHDNQYLLSAVLILTLMNSVKAALLSCLFEKFPKLGN